MHQITGTIAQVLNTARTHTASSSETVEAVQLFLQGLNSPRSLAVYMLFKYGEHQQLLDLKCDPMHYKNAFRFRDDYAATEFLSKSTFLKTGIDTAAVAMKKFFEFEEQCRQTNNRFLNLPSDPQYKGQNVWLLNAITRKISEVLGDYTPEEFFGLADWGPGVSTLLKGEHVSAYNKFHDERGITQYLYDLVGPFFERAYPLWYGHLSRETGEKWASIEAGNVIVTVAKNSKTDRTIAIEPGLNLWFQKSIGCMIRKRMFRRGIDLQHQEVNQKFALEGSKTLKIATVDFSSASDSISYRLVEALLPPAWFSLLSSCRCSRGKQSDGSLLKWEKFSSMGNGFTFELESLIFWAAASAVQDLTGSEGPVSVYGDDVIIPNDDFALFSSFCAFLGFTVNPKKSFNSSEFRESCGSHYFNGVDCKPIYLKDRLRNVKSIFKLANSVRWLSHRRNNYSGCDFSFLHCWSYLRNRVPKPLRFGVPAFVGNDTGIVSNFDEASPTRARDGFEGYRFAALIEVGVEYPADGFPLLLAKMGGSLGLSDSLQLSTKTPDVRVAFEDLPAYARGLGNILQPIGGGNTYTLRGRTKMFLKKNNLVAQWYNLGPWI